MTAQDDTKPRSPFKETPAPLPGDHDPYLQPVMEPDDESSGPGCFVWGMMGLIIFSMSLLIVGLAGAAGWSGGQRVANTNATATISSRIMQQLERIPTDVAGGNQQILSWRLDYLAGLTPAVPGVAEIQATATALYFAALPTATPTPTVTPTPTPTLEVTETAIDPASAYDLRGLLEEARRQVDLGMYEDAIDTLDVIMAIDSTYQQVTVRGLMGEALRREAARLFRSLDTLAQAILLTERATEFGPVGDLSYESYVAGLYLDAIRQTEVGDYLSSIRSLRQIYELQSTYKGVDIGRLLFDEYVAFAQAWAIGGDHCAAAIQYTNALNVLSSATIRDRRDTEQLLCEQGTPTPGPEGAQGEPTFAPVGVPGG